MSALAADSCVALTAVNAVLTAVSAAVDILVTLIAFLAVIVTVLTVFAASAVIAQFPAERFCAGVAVPAQPPVILAALSAMFSSVPARFGLQDAFFADLAVIPVAQCAFGAHLAGLTPVKIIAEQASQTFRAVVFLIALETVSAAFAHVLHVIAVKIPNDAVLTFRAESFRIAAEAVSAEPSPLVDDHISAAVGAFPALHAHGYIFIGEAYLKAPLAMDSVIQRDRAFDTYVTCVAPACHIAAVHAPVAVLAVFAVIDPLVAFRTGMSCMHIQARDLLEHYHQDQEHSE